MIALLYRPLSLERVALVAAGLVLATALYCIAYNGLAGRSESLGQALLWALVNIVPWYLAFEAAKRATKAAQIAAALALAFAASMLLHVLAAGGIHGIGFELVRRIPALLLVTGLLASGRLLASSRAAAPAPGAKAPLPLCPSQVDWVSAAGNYVELRGNGRTVLHRAPLSHVFVRIHRSILVRRERIARVRPNDVILHDGTSLRTGKRYRSTLH
jgi:DNA-binding LytR/AlgR family response regulator